jgi:acyl carrier protein
MTQIDDKQRQLIEQIVKDAIVDVLCEPGREFSMDDHLVKDLGIDSDDLSFLFVPRLLSALQINIPPKEWRRVGTGKEVCLLLEKYLSSKQPLR